MSAEQRADVIVVGAGIIGLAVAWRARERGLSVTVLERGRAAEGAAHVAAGMLAPVAEVEFGGAGRTLLELGLASSRLWAGFASELEEVSGAPVPLGGSETLFVARDQDEAAELERQLEFRRSLGLEVTRLRATEAREREPALAPTIRMALVLGGERTVDPRLALSALRVACERSGVRVREGAAVAGIEIDPGARRRPDRARVSGVRLRDGEVLAADAVVLAAGAWASELVGAGAEDGARPLVRPVKGQILRLRDPAGPGLLRGVVRFAGGYLVPRGDGRYALGATVEDRGYDGSPTAGAVHGLLCDARELVPGIDELEIEELCVGFRPGTPDNLPLLGAGAVSGLLWAGGHYRNGVLLTPVTAELVAGLLAPGPAQPHAGRPAPVLGDDERERLLAACSPLRFAAGAADAAAGREGAGKPPAQPAASSTVAAGVRS
jgi:glycine oxidase